MPYINGIFVVDHSYYNTTPSQNSAYSYHYQEPQLPPCTYIHPNSPAAQLGPTPEELAPILEHQCQFLRDEELAQPPPALTRSTTGYHYSPQIEIPSHPAHLSPQQEAAQIGITPEEFEAANKHSICEQAEWIATEEAEWRERERAKWQGEPPVT